MPTFGQTQYKDVSHMVRHLITTDLECQLNRNILIAKVWNMEGLGLTEEQVRKIGKMIPAESITRELRGHHARRQ